MKRIGDNPFTRALMKNKPPLSLFSIGDSYLNLEILGSLGNENLEDQKWLEQVQGFSFIGRRLNLRCCAI